MSAENRWAELSCMQKHSNNLKYRKYQCDTATINVAWFMHCIMYRILQLSRN